MCLTTISRVYYDTPDPGIREGYKVLYTNRHSPVQGKRKAFHWNVWNNSAAFEYYPDDVTLSLFQSDTLHEYPRGFHVFISLVAAKIFSSYLIKGDHKFDFCVFKVVCKDVVAEGTQFLGKQYKCLVAQKLKLVELVE